MTRNHRIAAIVLFTILAASGYAVYKWKTSEQRRVTKSFGGAHNVRIMRFPDRVEAYRVGKLADDGDVNKWQTAGVKDYPIIGEPVVLTKDTAKPITNTLLDPASYIWVAKACVFVPGVRLDFIRGEERLHVLLCFECDMASVFLDDKLVGGSNFDNGRATLLRDIRPLFPNDPAIQALMDQH